MLEHILGTMLGAGILGGLINSYLSDPQIEKPLSWWQHLIVGVGAAFMVPVFLNMISSHLISEITGTAMTSEILSKLLVLAGFCLLAAVSSRAFIRSMTDRLLQEVSAAKQEASAAKQEAKEAKEQAENAEAVASLSVEPPEPQESSPTASEAAGLAASSVSDVTDTERKILKAMIESRFAMRSLTGIAKEAQLSTAQVNQAMGRLLERALVAEGKNKDGQLRWYPTAQGRKVASEA